MVEQVFTSDTHASHQNIIRYSNRPFKDVEHMNTVMAANINAKLPSGGVLWHLGDWAFGGLQKCIDFRAMINPGIDIILILGNHDLHHMKHESFRKLFYSIHDVNEIHIAKQRIVLYHYAMRVWHNSHHGSWMLYGHSHGSLPDDPNSLSFDVGVDCHNYTPLSFDEVRSIMQRKQWKAVDHHSEVTN